MWFDVFFLQSPIKDDTLLNLINLSLQERENHTVNNLLAQTQDYVETALKTMQ